MSQCWIAVMPINRPYSAILSDLSGQSKYWSSWHTTTIRYFIFKLNPQPYLPKDMPPFKDVIWKAITHQEVGNYEMKAQSKCKQTYTNSNL